MIKEQFYKQLCESMKYLRFELILFRVHVPLLLQLSHFDDDEDDLYEEENLLDFVVILIEEVSQGPFSVATEG